MFERKNMEHFRLIRYFAVSLLLISSLASYAQQDALVSQYFFNPLYVNAGYAGSREMTSAVLITRNQWVGIDGAPVTQTLSLYGPVRKENMGLGIQIYNDAIGPTRNTGLIFTYAYNVRLGKEGKLSMGLQGSLNQLVIDWDKISTEEAFDDAFQRQDTYYVPDANFGLYYSSPKAFAGVSAHHLIESKFERGSVYRLNQERFYRHLYGLGGIVLKMNHDFHFRPSFLVKYVAGAPLDAEVDAVFLFREKFNFGMGIRNSARYKSSKRDNQLIGIIEYNFNEHWKFGYSYDADLNELRTYNSGSHEFMLAYNFSLYKHKILSPRYF